MWYVKILRFFSLLRSWILPNLTDFLAQKRPLLWLLGLAVGLGAALLAIVFRELIGFVQFLWAGEHSEIYLDHVRSRHWFFIWIAPIIGGLIVGLMLQFFMKSPRAGGVADVIEARHSTGKRIDFLEGLKAALVTIVSLGFGASAGREGPAIHLGASFSQFIVNRFSLTDAATRTIIAAGAASAVSASFNAPIAGVLFAHEVILGHYAMRAFVPIVLSSVVGSITSRIWFGEYVTFNIPDYAITSYLEFPAFFVLGIICAFVAIAFQFSLFIADYYAKDFKMSIWSRPVLGGVFIGTIGVFYPEILGIGYETTNNALWGRLPIGLMVTLIVLKIVATAITYASRFGGGVFSPALYLGALTGGVFGMIAVQFAPENMASDPALYAMLGMGAVAASVIGAPISTTVIAFELTGGYSLSIAFLFTIAVSHGVNQALHGRSFFQWQLEMRGLDVRDGPHRALLRRIRVAEFMRSVEGDEVGKLVSDLEESRVPVQVRRYESVETTLQHFDETGLMRLPVVDDRKPDEIIAWVEYTDAIDCINKHLIDAHEEAHR